MPIVRIFNQQYPPARGDRPFVQVRIEERPVSSLVWAPLESQALSPVDADPTHPQPRDLVTSSATQDPGYYRLVWIDSIAGEFPGDEIFSDADDTLTPIEKNVKAMMPRTWEALAGERFYGRDFLTLAIENAKYQELPEELAAQNDGAYTRGMQIFLSKAAALELMPAAIELWMRKTIVVNTTGTAENTSYSDPVAALKDLAKTLREQVAHMRGLPSIIGLTAQQGETATVTGFDDDNFVFVTAPPYDFDPAFAPVEAVGA